MELKRLDGRIDAETVFVEGRVMLAKKRDGAWVALNGVSTDPVHLRNRNERATWALAQGLKVKDVEAYVRVERRERAKAMLEGELEHCKSVLAAHGYAVTEKK
jgi:hypothetical protein